MAVMSSLSLRVRPALLGALLLTLFPLAAPTASAAPAAPPGLVVNEVETNGDDTDWVEFANTSGATIDLSGYSVLDSDDGHAAYRLPDRSVLPAGGHLVVHQLTATTDGFDFGLGSQDRIRLSDPDGVEVLDWSWSEHARVTWGRCPDGTGELTQTTASTPGAPNDCSSPVRINEVESDGATGDWVELTSVGATPVELGGYVLSDSDDDHRWTIPGGTTLAAGGHLVLTEEQFGFGLGKADSVRLFDPAGSPVDETSWTAHAARSWGRDPDGTGDFAETAEPTPGAVNRFADTVVPEVWPGGAGVRSVDAEDTFTGDLSGLAVAGDDLWAVQNGDGLLYRLDASTGAPRPGWEGGRRLRYPGGSGTPDAEGVSVVGDSLYVSTERDGDASSTSRPAVLQFAIPDDRARAAGDLAAVREWNLAADFPGLGANSGLEGVGWIPDRVLTTGGLTVDDGRRYDPADHPGHGDGLFVVAVEGTHSAYLYALAEDGSFERIATVGSDLAVLAEVQFDPTTEVLWLVCDEVCSGRTEQYRLTDGAFTRTALLAAPAEADPALANEGFAIGADCVDGVRTTWYADDNDTDGHSLRRGTLTCTADESPGSPTPSPSSPAPDPAPSDPSSNPAPSDPTSAVPASSPTDRTDPTASAPTSEGTDPEPSRSAGAGPGSAADPLADTGGPGAGTLAVLVAGGLAMVAGSVLLRRSR